MKLLSVVAATLISATSLAHAADTQAVIARAKERVESTDSRGAGRLVQVDASGKRSTSAFVVKTHWFPEGLRTLLELTPAQSQATGSASPAPAKNDGRISILFELRPDGQTTVQVFRPHSARGVMLPFADWSEGVAGSALDYEDFAPSELFWRNQTLLKSALLGTHECDVLDSKAAGSERSHYTEVQTWIDRATGYPLYVEKTLKDTGQVKEFTSIGLTQSDGVWIAKQVEIKTHGRAGSTLLLFERGSTRAHLTARDFSPEQILKFEDHP